MTSPPPELYVIACQRCRNKKIRCGREKPACKRCRQLSADCVYEPPRYGKRKHGANSGSNMDTPAPIESSYIPDILNRLDALENAVGHTAASPISSLSTHARRMDLKGYKFRVDPATNDLDEKIFIPPQIAVSWIQTFYDNQSTLGLLLPISKDFMLTIPSILGSPYVQVDVRVLILYYGALHHGMLLSAGLGSSEKSRYSLYFYRRALQHMEQWQLQDQVNELSLHVAFWMAHEAYSQLDFDLSHRLHGHACQIARDLGLLQLDAETPFPSSSISENSSHPLEHPRWLADTMTTVYRDVHRIYFWHILITNDYSFRHHLYRPGNIDLGTWKVGLPDFSTRQSLSNIKRDTKVYFEASLHLSLIELKYSDFENSSVLGTSAGGFLSDAEKTKLRDLLLEIVAVLSEWQVEQLLMQVSSKVNASLYAHLIWRATSMITSFLRMQPRSAVWPTEQCRILEHEAAHRSIKAMQRLLSFDFDQGDLYWNFGHFKCFFTPCLGILFGNILTTTSKELAVSDLALTLWVQEIISRWANERHELKSLELYLQTLNHSAQFVLQQRFPSFRPQAQAQAHRHWQSTLPRTVLPTDTGEPRVGQAINSDSQLPSSLNTGSSHEGELGDLYGCGIDVAELYNEPYHAILALEKSLLTEPDPHRQWWGFEH